MAARLLGYEDAIRLLGGRKSKAAEILDRGSAAAMLAFGIFDLFEARAEVVRLGTELLSGFSERLRGISRMDRTERIHAAHTIVMVSALFETLDEAMAELGIASPELTAAEVESLARQSAGTMDGSRIADFAMQPISGWLAGGFYLELVSRAGNFITGLQLWDRLDETYRERLMTLLRNDIPGRALIRYEEHLRRLAVESPEFGVWLALRSHDQTRGRLESGLAELDQLLRLVAAESLPDARRAALSRAYRAALDKPIAPSGTDVELRIPALKDSYLDHRYRVDESGGARVADQGSWLSRPVHDNLAAFLAGHLITRDSVERPLLILGQPGSGKSVLTKILAARLSAEGYLPVRVELRQVPADGDIQDQIEAAIRADTGEDVKWPRLVESAPEALPVVLLDGFDELLQASGVSHSDYLTRIARFQEREQDQGRPVIVIVTSRTAVVGRATIPAFSTVISLEPFDEPQIRAWLDHWAAANAEVFARLGIVPLTAETALRYRDLAEQPLLLLMLALYDTSANGVLADRATGIDETDIYERLLTEFARRELTKDPTRPASAEEIGRELTRLSIVAFAMFNRGQQWVDEAGLTSDLTALRLRDRPARPAGMRMPLSSGQLAVGRFFFIHSADAQLDGEVSHTYEFLHATFSEYLVARLVVRLLQEMAQREILTSFGLPSAIDDGMLHALLSFDCLAARAPIVTFLEGLVDRLPEETRDTVLDIVLRLHRIALEPRTESRFSTYLPKPENVLERYAAWSANLVVLAAVTGRELAMDALFPPGPVDPVFHWHTEALVWRALLWTESWTRLVETLDVRRKLDNAGRRMTIRLRRLLDPAAVPDLKWIYSARGYGSAELPVQRPADLQQKSLFVASVNEEVRAHALEPTGSTFPVLAHALFETVDGRVITPSNALTRALFATHTDDWLAIDDLLDLLVRMPMLRVRGSEREAFHATAYRILYDLLDNDAHNGRGWTYLPEIHRLRDRIAALVLDE